MPVAGAITSKNLPLEAGTSPPFIMFNTSRTPSWPLPVISVLEERQSGWVGRWWSMQQKKATLQNNVAVAATQAALTGHAWYAHCQCLQLLQKPWLKLRGMGNGRYKVLEGHKEYSELWGVYARFAHVVESNQQHRNIRLHTTGRFTQSGFVVLAVKPTTTCTLCCFHLHPLLFPLQASAGQRKQLVCC